MTGVKGLNQDLTLYSSDVATVAPPGAYNRSGLWIRENKHLGSRDSGDFYGIEFKDTLNCFASTILISVPKPKFGYNFENCVLTMHAKGCSLKPTRRH